MEGKGNELGTISAEVKAEVQITAPKGDIELRTSSKGGSKMNKKEMKKQRSEVLQNQSVEVVPPRSEMESGVFRRAKHEEGRLAELWDGNLRTLWAVWQNSVRNFGGTFLFYISSHLLTCFIF
jgi:hypothetical protein